MIEGPTGELGLTPNLETCPECPHGPNGNRWKNRGFHSRQDSKWAIKAQRKLLVGNPLTDWNRANFWYQDSPELYSRRVGALLERLIRVEAPKRDPGSGRDGPRRRGEGTAAGCSSVTARCARSLTFVRQGNRGPRRHPDCSEIDTRWPPSGSDSPIPSSSCSAALWPPT